MKKITLLALFSLFTMNYLFAQIAESAKVKEIVVNDKNKTTQVQFTVRGYPLEVSIPTSSDLTAVNITFAGGVKLVKSNTVTITESYGDKYARHRKIYSIGGVPDIKYIIVQKDEDIQAITSVTFLASNDYENFSNANKREFTFGRTTLGVVEYLEGRSQNSWDPETYNPQKNVPFKMEVKGGYSFTGIWK